MLKTFLSVVALLVAAEMPSSAPTHPGVLQSASSAEAITIAVPADAHRQPGAVWSVADRVPHSSGPQSPVRAATTPAQNQAGQPSGLPELSVAIAVVAALVVIMLWPDPGCPSVFHCVHLAAKVVWARFLRYVGWTVLRRQTKAWSMRRRALLLLLLALLLLTAAVLLQLLLRWLLAAI